MRTLQVSTEVFAAIWSLHQDGERDEDAILRRVLRVSAPAKRESQRSPGSGAFVDRKNGIELPEGFEIFRNYLGTEYKAVVASGSWQLTNTGRLYPDLSELSRAIGTKGENPWANWWCIDSDGVRTRVGDLRPGHLIRKRKGA